MQLVAQKKWHYGAYYSFGAAFNVNQTNGSPLKPSDGSSFGLLCRLENGKKALGFQAGLATKLNDVRHEIKDNYFLDIGFRAWELRLQCTLPVSSRSSFALGIAPRVVYRHSFSMVYRNTSNGAQSEYDISIKNEHADLNELNSAIIFSWQYELHKHWFFHLNIDQDIQKGYANDVLFENYDAYRNGEEAIHVNTLLTSITGSIVFLVK